MGERFKCNEETVVQTQAGKLRGFYHEEVYAFHGIRYARAERFLPPEPVKPWEGVKDALSYGYICPLLSYPRPTGELLIPHRFWPENENCQYLNVWTGTLKPQAKRPVLVWLHGGGFSSGSAIEQVCYEGDCLAGARDVVVVSVNHRLNVFGFLDLSDFGGKYANSVNAGMADIVAALKWVKENIASFGGNPDNVTIFGQSGGGAKVTALGQIPEADGLFHRAMVMSGVLSDELMFSNVEPRELVLRLLKELGLGEDEVDQLQRIPTRKLTWAVNRAEAALAKEGKRICWGPKANDWYLGDPLKVGFSEHFKTIPTIVGTVFAEFDMEEPIVGKDSLTASERRAIVAERFGEEHADQVIRLFQEAYPEKNEVCACNLDTVFRPETLRYIRKKAAESTAPVYAYLFSAEFDYGGGKLAWHCSDLPFWFATANRIPVCQMDGDASLWLEERMSMSLVNFARTGNPNTAGLPWWEPCDGEHVKTMVLDTECGMRIDHEAELLAYAAEHKAPFRFEAVMDEDEEGSAWVY